MRMLSPLYPVVKIIQEPHIWGVETLGSAIRTRRKRLDLTQERVSETSGVPQGTISRIERGDYKEMPPPDLLNPIARALDTTALPFLIAAGYETGHDPPPLADDPAMARLVEALESVRLDDERIQGLHALVNLWRDLDRKASEPVQQYVMAGDE